MPPVITTHLLAFFILCFHPFGKLPVCSAEKLHNETSCPLELSVVIPNSVIMKENGSLWDPFGGIYYPNGSYYETVWDKSRRGKGEDEYWGCPCNLGILCLRKCCPSEEANIRNSECVLNDVFCPKRVAATDLRDQLSDLLHDEGRFALFSQPESQGVYLVGPEGLFSHCEFRRGNNSEKCTSHSLEDLLDGENYCILPTDKYEGHPLACETSYSLWFGVHRYVLNFPYGRMLAVIAFVVAFVIYAIIPELRNLHGKMLLSHLSALIAANFISLVAIVYSLKVDLDGCLFFAFAIQFFFLASFFWLNIICYDIYSTFRHVSPINALQPRKENKKMLLYTLYAWGCPLIILSVSLLLELTPGIPDSVITPDFRVNICWFYSTVASVIYFLGFSSFLVGVNIFLFILTAYKIYKLKKGTDILTNRESVLEMESVKKSKQRYDMYLKLLIMMGFLRMVEIMFRLWFHSNKLLPITDYTEGVNGFLSFLIFVWKDDILDHLKQRFCPCLLFKPEGVTLRRR